MDNLNLDQTVEEITLKDALKATSFRFNKALGQNFISDKNLLDAIVADSDVSSDDVILEIGAGGGTLTRALAARAKKVFSFEVDKSLEQTLSLMLRGCNNVEIIFKDVMKMSESDLSALAGGRFKVVANLPYYITTPVIMRFVESALDVETIVVTVQKEVADRLVAKPNTPEYAAITLAIEIVGDARITRTISRNMFYPSPNVDSAVVRIDINRNKLKGENIAFLNKIVRAAFAMRRKTLANNLSVAFGISKTEATDRIVSVGLPPLVRGEALDLKQYISLSHAFSDMLR